MAFGHAFPPRAHGERFLRDGSLAVTPTQLGLLQGLLERPDATTHSRIDWVSASRPHLRWTRAGKNDALIRSTLRMPASWVTRGKLRGRYRCTLAKRGRDILERRVPVTIVGHGPYRGTAALIQFARCAMRARASAHERQWIPEMRRGTCLLETCAVFGEAARWLRQEHARNELQGNGMSGRELLRVAGALEACVGLAKSCAYQHTPVPPDSRRCSRVRQKLHKTLWELAQAQPPRLDDMLDYNNAWAAHGVGYVRHRISIEASHTSRG
jgi:hypothetical protein